MSGVGTPLFEGRIFPGLRPFEQEDALLFFGRESQTDDLLRRLDDTRFIAVVGLSGSGKSSLVRAGLLPALYRGHLDGAGPRWRVAVMRPGPDPLPALARLLDETLGSGGNRLSVLRSGSLGLLDASRRGRARDENLLIVVDQFEEIFRYPSSGSGPASDPEGFVALLLAACREGEPDYRVYVVITLRSDYLGECARFSGLPETLNESQYLVPRMTPAQLREAIEGPAALGGGRVAGDLLEALLAKASADADQLPVLQHLLMRMWEVRSRGGAGWILTGRDHDDVGGWEHALDRHADEVLGALPEERQRRAERIFRRLTGKGQGRREDRQPATLEELAAIGQDPDHGETRAVVEHFRGEGRGFLTSRDRELTAASVVEIGHESLIRRWARLRDWVERERLSGEWYRRIEDRRAHGGSLLSGPELEAALKAREEGAWNAAWAKRYSVLDGSGGGSYEEVLGFLEQSRAKRTDELASLRRARRRAAMIASLFFLLFLGTGYFWWSASRARAEAERLQYVSVARSLLSAASQERLDGQDEVAALLALQSYRFGWREPDLHSKIDEALRESLAKPYFGRILLSNESRIHAVATGANGDVAVFGDDDGAVRLTRLGERPPTAVELGRHESDEGVRQPVLALAVGADGREIVSLSQSEIVTWDTARPSSRVSSIRAEANGEFTCLALSPDGRRIAAGAAPTSGRTASEVRLWESGVLKGDFRGHRDRVTSVAFGHDGTLLAAGSYDGSILVWDLRDPGRTPRKLTAEEPIQSLAFSPTSEAIAAGSSRGNVWYWDLEGAAARPCAPAPCELTGPRKQVQSVTFHSGGRELAAGSLDQRVYVWNLRQPAASASSTPLRLPGHHGFVMSVASGGTGILVSGSFDRTVRVWEPSSDRSAPVPLGKRLLSAAFGPGGSLLASGGDENDGQVQVWDLREPSGGPSVLAGHEAGVTALAFSGDLGRVAAGDLGNEVWVWDRDHPQKPLRVFSRDTDRTRHVLRVSAVAMDRDGGRLASADIDGALFLWNVGTSGAIALRRSGSGRIANAVAFSPDGRQLAAGESTGVLSLWDLSQRAGESTPRELVGGDGQVVTSLAFSGTGEKLAWASEGRHIYVGDPSRAGAPTLTLESADRVTALAFSPYDGSLLAAAAFSGAVNVWHLDHPKAPPLLVGNHGQQVWSLSFPSASSLASVDRHEIRYWPLTASLAERVCESAGRNLTRGEWDRLVGSSVPYDTTCRDLPAGN